MGVLRGERQDTETRAYSTRTRGRKRVKRICRMISTVVVRWTSFEGIRVLVWS